MPIGEVHENINLVAFRDTIRYSEVSWACANDLIYATPQHLAICRAVEIIIENRKNNFHGINQLSPTGPYILAKELQRMVRTSKLFLETF